MQLYIVMNIYVKIYQNNNNKES